MGIEELKCDILDILENDDRLDILRKWTSSCREFRSCLAARIEKTLLYEKDCTQKKSVNSERMLELQREIDIVKSNIDAAVLQQKIIDKKISNAVKSQESLQDELLEAKTQKDALSLEMVDLQLELDQRKTKKISQWDAIKRACNIYKVNLDIHINLQEKEDCQYIKFSFFTHNKDLKDKYFVQLSCSDSCWTLEQMEPKLSKKHFNELNAVTDFAGHSKITDITLFLCEVRNLYLTYYMNMRKELLSG